MSVFSAAVDLIFADPNMAADCDYRTGGADPAVPVRVIRNRPDDMVSFGQSRIVTDTVIFDVRAVEVALPGLGDTLTIGADIFEVIAAPTIDRERLVWRLECGPV